MGPHAHFLLEISAACETQRLRGLLSAVNVGNLNSRSGLFGYQRVHTGEGALWMQLMRRTEKAMAQYSCLENPMDGGAWWAAVHGVAKTRTRLNDFHFSLSCAGEGNGNPLQCSCLENPRGRGAWWAAVCGVARSQTRLKWLSSSTSVWEALL